MHERPTHVTDHEILAVVAATWLPEADRVQHLPVGFGAHHWAAYGGDRPIGFVTLDSLGRRHTRDTLATAYAGAATLAAELPFVHAGRPPYVVPCGGDALSLTPWVDGARPTRLDAAATAHLLRRLHAAPPPPDLVRWTPVVAAEFPDDLRRRLAGPWTAGPYAERAHALLAGALPRIGRWVARYHHLAAVALDRPWVATHGEPGSHNQLLTADRQLLLVDWESLLLAPPERDTRSVGLGDREMLELFDLDWRLDEVSQYATWFEQPHGDADDDREAFGGLVEELAPA